MFVCFFSFWMVGSIFAATAAWIVLGDWFTGDRIIPGGTWRHYALIAALPAAVTLLLTAIFVPESPRFLAKAGISCARPLLEDNGRLGPCSVI